MTVKANTEEFGRVVATVRGVKGVAHVHHNSDWEEYVVVFRGTYHTDDKADALSTARVMVGDAQ